MSKGPYTKDDAVKRFLHKNQRGDVKSPHLSFNEACVHMLGKFGTLGLEMTPQQTTVILNWLRDSWDHWERGWFNGFYTEDDCVSKWHRAVLDYFQSHAEPTVYWQKPLHKIARLLAQLNLAACAKDVEHDEEDEEERP